MILIHKKNKTLCLAFLLLFSAFPLNDFPAAYGEDAGSEAAILNSAEVFFISLKQADFKAAWERLSDKSRRTIIDEEYGILKEKINKEDLIKDFESGGERFLYYWNTYVEGFDPDLALKKAVWKMGEIKNDKAVIILHVEGDAELRMFKEDGKWKVGLVESFWTRK